MVILGRASKIDRRWEFSSEGVRKLHLPGTNPGSKAQKTSQAGITDLRRQVFAGGPFRHFMCSPTFLSILNQLTELPSQDCRAEFLDSRSNLLPSRGAGITLEWGGNGFHRNPKTLGKEGFLARLSGETSL